MEKKVLLPFCTQREEFNPSVEKERSQTFLIQGHKQGSWVVMEDLIRFPIQERIEFSIMTSKLIDWLKYQLINLLNY